MWYQRLNLDQACAKQTSTVPAVFYLWPLLMLLSLYIDVYICCLHLKLRILLLLLGIANDAGEITLIPISMNTTQESKEESPVSLTAQSLIGASPKQTHLTKAQEVHSAGINKPKRTGSLALFYRKVCMYLILLFSLRP